MNQNSEGIVSYKRWVKVTWHYLKYYYSRHFSVNRYLHREKKRRKISSFSDHNVQCRLTSAPLLKVSKSNGKHNPCNLWKQIYENSSNLQLTHVYGRTKIHKVRVYDPTRFLSHRKYHRERFTETDICRRKRKQFIDGNVCSSLQVRSYVFFSFIRVLRAKSPIRISSKKILDQHYSRTR